MNSASRPKLKSRIVFMNAGEVSHRTGSPGPFVRKFGKFSDFGIQLLIGRGLEVE